MQLPAVGNRRRRNGGSGVSKSGTEERDLSTSSMLAGIVRSTTISSSRGKESDASTPSRLRGRNGRRMSPKSLVLGALLPPLPGGIDDLANGEPDQVEERGRHEDADESFAEQDPGEQKKDRHSLENDPGRTLRRSRHGEEDGEDRGQSDEQRGRLLQAMRGEQSIDHASGGKSDDDAKQGPPRGLRRLCAHAAVLSVGRPTRTKHQAASAPTGTSQPARKQA